MRVWFRRYVASVGWWLNAVCLLSILVILSHDVFFADWPALSPLVARLWNLIYQLGLALVASYVFFYINAHLGRLQEKDALRPFLYRYSILMVDEAERLSRIFGMATGLGGAPTRRSAAYGWELEKWPDDNLLPDPETAMNMCRNVNPHETVPQYSENWFEFLSGIRDATIDSLSRIYTTTLFLEPEYLRLVADVEETVRLLDVPPHPTPGNSLAFMSTNISSYFERTRRLRDYAYRNFTVSGSPESLRFD